MSNGTVRSNGKTISLSCKTELAFSNIASFQNKNVCLLRRNVFTINQVTVFYFLISWKVFPFQHKMTVNFENMKYSLIFTLFYNFFLYIYICCGRIYVNKRASITYVCMYVTQKTHFKAKPTKFMHCRDSNAALS